MWRDVFGEDLAVLCIDVIKKSMCIYPTTIDIISTVFSSCNFCFSALFIMLKIAFVGLSQINSGNSEPGAMCVIKFLIGVGISGFYVLYRYITAEVSNEIAGDMILLYILYILISTLHSYIFITMLKEY